MSDGAETGALFPEEAGQEPVMTKGQTHAVGILPAHGIQNMVREKQIWATGGVLDNYPANMGIQLQFDATIADVAGNPTSGGAFSASNGGVSTADITDLNNESPWDFVRFEALFDLNISGDPANLDLGAPLPGLLFVKIPYAFGSEP